MKKLLNRIETSSSSSGTSTSVQLPSSSSSLNNNGGGGGSGAGGGGSGSASNNSGGSSTQSSVLGKTISLKKISNICVEEIIAEGGFGIVYLAKSNSVKYALKRVVVNNDIDLSVVTREIQIMTTLSHPNLLPCIDFTITSLGNNVTEALLLMPYYRATLLHLLNQRMASKTHLSEKDILLILLDIVSAIARLHHCTTPIIHRDIKIENVLIDEVSSSSTSSTSSASAAAAAAAAAGSGGAGNPETVLGNLNKYILCDFGSATAKIWDPNVHSVQSIQDDLEKYTTLAYRSPEMVDLYSNRGTLNTKLDIWALGVFAYKVCFYTTPFGDSILAIQSANVNFPSSSTYSPALHALMYYLLTPDPTQRPDIFQTGEIISQLLKIKNPIQNLNGSPLPPGIDTLMNNMTTKKVSSSVNDAVIINKAASSSVIPLETSVTPRQRPKGTTILQAPTNGSILIIPPPKSPCKLLPDPGSGANFDIENKLTHRRNMSDSSAFEKGQLQPSTELSSTSSEQAISSWNPFEEHLTATTTSATMSSTAPTTTDSTTNVAAAAAGGGDEDDPFENAPFEFFKYQPIDLSEEDDDDVLNARYEDHSPVDLFGAAPFSNPFLEFSLGNERAIDGVDNTAQLQQPPTQRQPKLLGCTNLSYED